MSNYDEYPVQAIAELLEELCPEGVPNAPLGDFLVDLRTGLNPRKNFTLNTPDANNHYITVRELGGFTVNPSADTDLVNDEGLAKISRRCHLMQDDILFSGVGTVGRTAIVHEKPTNWGIKEGIFALTLDPSRANSRYLVYWFHSSRFKTWLASVTSHGSMATISMTNLKKAPVSLPSPKIQEQIVAILDTFTDLDASLMRELVLRNDQFTHALDSVFGNSTAPRSTLGQVGDFTKGKGVTKSQLQDEGLPTFHYGQVHTSYGHSATSTISYVDPELIKNPTLAHPGDLVLATTSEDDKAVGKAVAWLGDEDAVVGGDAYVYSHSLEPRYASYFFASHDFQLQKGSKVSGTKVRRINDKGLSALTIPVPAPEVQEQIADTLDMFTEYTANLRREIELRRQQLAYYREQLLTFPVAE